MQSVVPSWGPPQTGVEWNGRPKRPRVAGARGLIEGIFDTTVVGRDTAEHDQTNPKVTVALRLRLFERENWVQGIRRGAPLIVLKKPALADAELGGSDVFDDVELDPLVSAMQVQPFNYLLHRLELEGGLASVYAPGGRPTLEWIQQLWTLGGVMTSSELELTGDSGQPVYQLKVRGREENCQNLWQYGSSRASTDSALQGGAYLFFVITRVAVGEDTAYVTVTGEPPRHLPNRARDGRLVRDVWRVSPYWNTTGVVPASVLRYRRPLGNGLAQEVHGWAWPFGRVVENRSARVGSIGSSGFDAARGAFDADEAERGLPLAVDIHTGMGGLLA